MTKAVLKAGLITTNMLREMKRFSITLDRDAEVEEPTTLEEAAKIVGDALESSDQTIVRETDLAVLRQYIDTSTSGEMHVEVMGTPAAEFDVTYGKTRLGEYIIAWRSESIGDALTNGMTYLDTGDEKVYFKDVRELWFGDNKAFMLCIPNDSPT
jgi:hypothetical protein